MKISTDIILEILQYLESYKLNKLAESAIWWRHIINWMDKIKYIDRWLHINSFTNIYHYSIYTDTIKDILSNKWYFKLIFTNI